jgi:anti-sigma28 factor (negative regulator of flagellin synthesis)
VIQNHSNAGSNDKSIRSSNLRSMSKRPLSRNRVLRYDSPLLNDKTSPDAASDERSALGDANMEVTGAGSVGRTGGIRAVQSANASEISAAAPTNLQAPQDEILISDAARSLSDMQLDPQVRAARLAEIKTAIDSGSYDTPQRLEAAIDKMIVAWQRGH